MKHESQVDALNNAVKEREKLAALVEHERKIHSEDAQALRKERDRCVCLSGAVLYARKKLAFNNMSQDF